MSPKAAKEAAAKKRAEKKISDDDIIIIDDDVVSLEDLDFGDDIKAAPKAPRSGSIDIDVD